MAAAQIVSFDASAGTYWIPEDHWPALKKGDKFSKAVLSTLSIPMLSEAFCSVKECFKLGGPAGVPPEQYSHFDRYLSDKNSVWFNHYMLQSFMPSIPGLVHKLEEGICVLDVACGAGEATIAMAKQFSKSQFYAFDICESAVRTAQAKVRTERLTNAHMVCQDASCLPSDWSGKFQYIISRSGIHDLPFPRAGLAELHRVLSDDGVASILEPECHSSLAANLDVAWAGKLYAFSLMNCLPVSLSCEGSEGLGAAWGREAATAMLQECGFRIVSVSDVLGDITMHFYCQKKEAKLVLFEASSDSSDPSEDAGPTKAEAFASVIADKGGGGLPSLALAVGRDVGLLDVMIARGQPMSCQEIAEAGKFKERYVREWLGAMVTSRIVCMDTSHELYWIPKHHVPSLQRSGVGSDPCSIPALSESFYRLVQCFKLDGPQGVSLDKHSQLSKYTCNDHSIWSVFQSAS
ncbi:uncharacterized protein LOC119726748 isoform X2 [Patiria miniata]|nr:uncharacterized protein LOC119726748 isoform X2 [Patiria miniata]